MIRSTKGLAGAAALLIAACTSPADAPSSTLTPLQTPAVTVVSTTIAPDEGADAFRGCLAEHGVEIQVIPLDATGRPRLDMATEDLDFDDPLVEEAVAVCAPALGSGSLDLSGDEMLRDFVVAQLAAFSECVRSKGVEGFPDPMPGFVGVGSAYPVAEIPYADPELPAALEICRDRILGDLSGN